MTDDLCPHPDDPLMAIAWASCVRWVMLGKGEAPLELRRQFEEESGLRFVAPSGRPLDRMVDEACNIGLANDKYVHDFIVWINENVWGDDDAPTEEDE